MPHVLHLANLFGELVAGLAVRVARRVAVRQADSLLHWLPAPWVSCEYVISRVAQALRGKKLRDEKKM